MFSEEKPPNSAKKGIMRMLETVFSKKSFEPEPKPPEGIDMDLVPTLNLGADKSAAAEPQQPQEAHPAHHHHAKPAKVPNAHLAHVSITPTAAGSYLLTGMCIADGTNPSLIGKWVNTAPILLEQFPERLTLPPSVIDTMSSIYRVDSWAVNPMDVLNAIRIKDAKRTIKHKVTLEIEVPFDHDDSSWTSEAGGVLMVQDLLVSPALADSLNKVVGVYNTPNLPKDEQWKYIKQQEAKQALVKSIVIQHQSTERVQS